MIVIDTNIVLDLFVFKDPLAQPLAQALATQTYKWIATAPMRDELEHLRRTSSRRKSDFGLRLRRWFSRVFLGREPRDVKIIEAASGEKSVLHNHVTINDASAIKELRDTLAKMKAAVQPALASA